MTWSRPVSRAVLLCIALVASLALTCGIASAGHANVGPGTGQSSAAVLTTAPDWLLRLNETRSWAGLPAVIENPVWSQACWLHARYMSENDWIGHTEDPANPWYTPEGEAAARQSNCALGTGGVTAIEGLATAPFHALPMLSPRLEVVGFGSYSAPKRRPAAALDVWSGGGATPSDSAYPVTWPGPGSEVTLLTYAGGEYPNPLAGRGAEIYEGLPIIVEFAEPPAVTSASLISGGEVLTHALITAANYSSPRVDEQELGRSALEMMNAIIIMPRKSLVWGSTYRVSLTNHGQELSWSFHVAPEPTNSLKVSRRTAKVGQMVNLSGTVQHAITGHSTVGLYVMNGPREKRVASVKLAGSGDFSWTFKARTLGKAYYVAVYDVPGVWHWYSKSLLVTVRR